MNRICITLFLGLTISGCTNGQDDQENQSSPKIEEQETTTSINIVPEYKVDFPKIELENYSVTEKVTTPPNMPSVTNWLLEGRSENGPFMYFVAHNKIPKDLETLLEKEPDQLGVALRAMLTSSSDKLGGFDFVYSEIEYNGFLGIHSTCKVFNGEGMIKSKVYLFDKDIFIISGGGKGIDEEKLDDFLASFRLLE